MGDERDDILREERARAERIAREEAQRCADEVKAEAERIRAEAERRRERGG